MRNILFKFKNKYFKINLIIYVFFTELINYIIKFLIDFLQTKKEIRMRYSKCFLSSYLHF